MHPQCRCEHGSRRLICLTGMQAPCLTPLTGMHLPHKPSQVSYHIPASHPLTGMHTLTSSQRHACPCVVLQACMPFHPLTGTHARYHTTLTTSHRHILLRPLHLGMQAPYCTPA